MQKRMGFTLIELIVVLSIIGILSLIGLPKYKEYSNEARLTRLKVNIKELETASTKYYMTYNAWPRLSDIPYTSDEVSEFGEKILAKTGQTVVLDAEGNYYDIDYDKIHNYVKVPTDGVNYILQNPVGSVFYIEGITEPAKVRLTNPELLGKEIVFNGPNQAMFDKDELTGTDIGGLITWDGNIGGRQLNIVSSAGWYPGGGNVFHTLSFFDGQGNKLNFIGGTQKYGNSYSFGGVWGEKDTANVIVPDGAVSMSIVIGAYSGRNGHIYEIYLTETSKRPQPITSLEATSTEYSVTLTWNHSEREQKKIVTRDGKYVGFTYDNTFTEYPVFHDSNYIYEVYVINEYGNSSQKAVKAIRTLKPEVVLTGLSEVVYDKIESTSTNIGGSITWNGDISGRKINILSAAGYYPGGGHGMHKLTFLDSEGNILYFYNDSGSLVNTYSFGGMNGKTNTVSVIVPDGAVSMNITIGAYSRNKGTIHEIYLSKD